MPQFTIRYKMLWLPLPFFREVSLWLFIAISPSGQLHHLNPALALQQLDSCDEGRLCWHDWDFANNHGTLGSSQAVYNSTDTDDDGSADVTDAADETNDNVDCRSGTHERHSGIDALTAHSIHSCNDHSPGDKMHATLLVVCMMGVRSIQSLLYLRCVLVEQGTLYHRTTPEEGSCGDSNLLLIVSCPPLPDLLTERTHADREENHADALARGSHAAGYVR